MKKGSKKPMAKAKQSKSQFKKLKLPKNRSARIRLGLFVSAFAMVGTYFILSSFALPLVTNDDCHDLTRGFNAEAGLGRVCHVKSGHAKGLVKVLLNDSMAIYTHGGDPRGKVNQTAAPGTTGATYDAPIVAPTCADTNSFQILYALPAGKADRLGSIIGNVQNAFRSANGVIHTEAAKFNKTINLRVRCDSNGNPLVTDVHLSTSSTDFGTIASDLKSKGYANSAHKYAVWYDGASPQGWAGFGSFASDDRAVDTNANNNGGTFYAMMYGNNGSGGDIYSGIYWMHELAHTMGAVQYSAPHSSGAAHCNDGQDVLCYADGGSKSNFNGNVCPYKSSGNFDCNDDDYFNPNPPAGSYLATHWNIAASYNHYLFPSSTTTSSSSSSTSAGSSATPLRIDTFVTGTDRKVWQKTYSNGWSGWQSLGECIQGTPTATSWGPNRIDAFVADCNTHQLIHKWWNGSSWQREQLFNSCLDGGPAASSWGGNRIDVFARACSSNNLIHAWFDGSWHSWENLGGTLTAAPAAASWGTNRIDVVVRGTDNSIWHKYYSGSWSGWESLGGSTNYSPAIVSWGSNRIDVFATGTNNVLLHKWWPNSPGWLGNSGWESLGGNLTSSPGATSWGTGRIDVFGRGSSGDMQHKFYQSSWSGWESLGGQLYSTTGVGAVSWNRF